MSKWTAVTGAREGTVRIAKPDGDYWEISAEAAHELASALESAAARVDYRGIVMAQPTQAQLEWLYAHPTYLRVGLGGNYKNCGTLYADGSFDPMAP